VHEGVGVCREFAHLAIALCRCMNIPARYCTGYLGDIGVPVDINPMDFIGWFEVCLDWRWYTMTRVTIIPASAGLLWGAGVTPQTSRSRPPSASPISRASSCDHGAGSEGLNASRATSHRPPCA
jgi:hypothetical protein